jgi:ribulose 1,5-bisphosphate synthetase/thiazole synthase
VRNIPFWIDSAPLKRFPRLEKNLSVDFIVVGAGITGITAAYLLKETGLTVALVERERLASMDTGHTTAHLTCITDVELQELARN